MISFYELSQLFNRAMTVFSLPLRFYRACATHPLQGRCRPAAWTFHASHRFRSFRRIQLSSDALSSCSCWTQDVTQNQVLGWNGLGRLGRFFFAPSVRHRCHRSGGKYISDVKGVYIDQPYSMVLAQFNACILGLHMVSESFVLACHDPSTGGWYA